MPGIDSFSDELLSRWIAEKLEPKPTWAKGQRTGGFARDALSDCGIWWIEDHHLGTKNETLAQHPRDMVHDPAMTLLLQKQLIAQGKRLHYAAEDGDEYLTVFDGHDWKLGKEFIGSLERTTAEAWALAHGWKAE